MPIEFEYDWMKNEWVVCEKPSFLKKKFFWKILEHFWKLKFLGKVIQHMPVKFEQHGKKNKWEIRKKPSFFQKKNF